MLIQVPKVNASNESQDAQADDPSDQKPERADDKLIRLDDLIPKGTVKGGRQLLFGATDTSEETHKPRKES
jgi:hypothetical protein